MTIVIADIPLPLLGIAFYLLFFTLLFFSCSSFLVLFFFFFHLLFAIMYKVVRLRDVKSRDGQTGSCMEDKVY